MVVTAPRFGVYIHWPYCAAICPYCDFNVYRARGNDPTPLLHAIAADLAGHAARFGARPAETVFLGGGTPSLLSGAEVAALLDVVDRSFGLAPGAEVTLEANPEDAARFADHAAAGVTRFSLGLQALDDRALKVLGRWHDAAAGRRAVEAAAATGRRVSLDLIYARPEQTVAAWERELAEALALPVKHLSLYQLTIEAGTAFDRAVQRGALRPPDAEPAAALFEATQALCEAAGFSAYEISNHARTDAARSRHNLLYWTGGDWVGAGPGAHGRITDAQGRRMAVRAAVKPADYVAQVSEAAIGWRDPQLLTQEEAGDELLMMGLRIAEGLARADLEAAWGRRVSARKLAELTEAGLLAEDLARLRLTAAGRLVADRVAAELAAAD